MSYTMRKYLNQMTVSQIAVDVMRGTTTLADWDAFELTHEREAAKAILLNAMQIHALVNAAYREKEKIDEPLTPMGHFSLASLDTLENVTAGTPVAEMASWAFFDYRAALDELNSEHQGDDE